MSVITAILSPSFLVNNIDIIALVASVMVLVFFDDFVVEKFIFPIADFVKFKVFKHVGLLYEKKGITSWWAKASRKYVSEALATALVVLYCYSGSVVLGIYVLEPVFQRWKSFISIVVIVLFLMANYVINNSRMRKRFFGLGVFNPEKSSRA